jgi:hypothetical protein
MAYLGKVKNPGSCAICKESFPAGEIVYFDGTKAQGNHLAHKDCLDALTAKRKYPKIPTGPLVSTEPLDPPF